MRLSSTFLALLLFLFSAVTTHAVYSLALTIHASRTFTVRGPNVRYYPISEKPIQITSFRLLTKIYELDDTYPLTVAYLRHRLLPVPQQNRMLVVGSSLSWGYPMKDTESLAGVLQRSLGTSATVADASIIGFGLDRAKNTLCYLRDQALQPAVIIIEVPVTNTLWRIAEGDRNFLPLHCSNTVRRNDKPADYFSLFFRNPDGLSYFTRLRPSFADREGSRTMKKPSHIPKQFQIKSAAIDSNQDIIRNHVKAVLTAAASYSSQTIVFFQPIHRPAFKQLGVDDASIDAFTRHAFAACREHPDVTCLEPFAEIEQEQGNFFNVSHLNKTGMERLAEKLIVAIQ